MNTCEMMKETRSTRRENAADIKQNCAWAGKRAGGEEILSLGTYTVLGRLQTTPTVCGYLYTSS